MGQRGTLGAAAAPLPAHQRVPLAGGTYRAFFFNDTPPPDIYTLSLHDALPILTSRLSLSKHLAHNLGNLLNRSSIGRAVQQECRDRKAVQQECRDRSRMPSSA